DRPPLAHLPQRFKNVLEASSALPSGIRLAGDRLVSRGKAAGTDFWNTVCVWRGAASVLDIQMEVSD
ncbi:MAG: hypothetical protein ABSG72_18845, partial [Candidatus Sulfotelmatobacter sp.]